MFIETPLRLLALLFIRFYQQCLSIFFGGQCRFHPTCSSYAFEAVEKHSFLKAVSLTFKRICRCHPFNKGGYDPVPESSKKDYV